MGRRKDWEKQTDWENMTDEQKFEFLYAWCHKLEAILEGRSKVIYRLDAELRKGEKKRGPKLRREKVK
jgi:hypothetical protein